LGAQRLHALIADAIAGKVGEVNYHLVPSVIYTAPEIAWVGLTEEQAKEGGRAYKVGSFPFMASGRARAMDVKGLMDLATKVVWRRLGVALEAEVRLVGDW